MSPSWLSQRTQVAQDGHDFRQGPSSSKEIMDPFSSSVGGVQMGSESFTSGIFGGASLWLPQRWMQRLLEFFFYSFGSKTTPSFIRANGCPAGYHIS